MKLAATDPRVHQPFNPAHQLAAKRARAPRNGEQRLHTSQRPGTRSNVTIERIIKRKFLNVAMLRIGRIQLEEH